MQIEVVALDFKHTENKHLNAPVQDVKPLLANCFGFTALCQQKPQTHRDKIKTLSQSTIYNLDTRCSNPVECHAVGKKKQLVSCQLVNKKKHLAKEEQLFFFHNRDNRAVCWMCELAVIVLQS